MHTYITRPHAIVNRRKCEGVRQTTQGKYIREDQNLLLKPEYFT